MKKNTKISSETALKNRSLKTLHALILDIQATGQNPETNVLLEMGWQAINGVSEKRAGKINSTTITLPDGYTVPNRVVRITGITEDDFAHAIDEKKVWQRVNRSAKGIINHYHSSKCPVIIHYARFEMPYLTLLHQRHSSGSAFPFQIICTHDIVRRLLPSLPRRGLRAIAGYFGFSVEQLRRSSHHVAATAFIWSNIVPLLREEGITTLGELLNWLSEKPSSTRSGRAYPMDSAAREGLPDAPGVYKMMRSNGDILYVGKATSLKQRVNSYFQKKAGHAEHILEMLSQAKRLSVVRTDTSLEAALLETDEIKKLKPPYNISLQEKSRTVVFFTRGFDAQSEKQSKRFCVGPVVSPDLFSSVYNLGRVCNSLLAGNKITPETTTAVLGISETYAPESEIILQGLQLFFESYCDKMNQDSIIKSLLRIGRQIWQDRLEEEVEEDIDEITAEEIVEKEFVWTPEAVVRVLESTVSHAAHHIRRARWYCILSESSLKWQMKGEGEEYRCLMVRNGAVHNRIAISDSEALPVPPGYRKRTATRKNCFDIPTYDRMRVLTTEIRRLVKEGKTVTIRFGPLACITNSHLERLLKWV